MQTKTAKRGNRLLCLLLAVLMVCSLLPVSALAVDGEAAELDGADAAVQEAANESADTAAQEATNENDVQINEETAETPSVSDFDEAAAVQSDENELPIIPAQSEEAADEQCKHETIEKGRCAACGDYEVVLNVAPSTASVTFYDSNNEAVTDVVDCGIVDNFHRYKLYVVEGRYSYKGIDAGDDNRDLGGMCFDVPFAEEIIATGPESGEYSGKGMTMTLLRVNFYTTNTNVTEIGDFEPVIMGGVFPTAVNGTQYINSDNRVVTPVMVLARGNACVYQISFKIGDRLSDKYGASPQGNVTYVDTLTATKNNTFTLTELVDYTITAPSDAAVKVFNQIRNFNVEELEPWEEPKDNGDGTSTWLYKYALGNSYLSYRVSKPGEMTQAGWFKNTADSATVSFSGDPKTTESSNINANVIKCMESSTMVNVNTQNNLTLDVDGIFRLRSYRAAWQIINSITANGMIEPDFNYNIISGGEHIALTPADNRCTGNAGTGAQTNWMDIKGVSSGTAIVEVSYDAINVGGNGFGGTYGATDPTRTSLIVIQVGQETGALDMKLPGRDQLFDTEFDTIYTLDDTASFTFNATLNGAAAESVMLSTDKGATWTPVSVNADGSYTASGLIPGNNILKFTTGSVTAYQVVRADKISYTLTNKSREGTEIYEGDTLEIVFNGLQTPIAKFSGIYNPGFGSNSGHKSVYEYAEDSKFSTSGGQYDYITSNKIVWTVGKPDENGHAVLKNGSTQFGVMGVEDPLGGHRKLNDIGTGTNFSAVNTEHVRNVLPDIVLDVKALSRTQVAFNVNVENAVVVLKNNRGNAEVAPEEDGTFNCTAGSYSYAVTADGYVQKRGEFTISETETESRTINVVLEPVTAAAWDGVSVSEPAQDESGTYLIGTGAELAWFAQTVNGGQNSINARLTADIELAYYNWTPIGTAAKPYMGKFNGDKHVVMDLSIESGGNYQALFGYLGSGAELKKLGVTGAVTTGGNYAGGISGYMAKSSSVLKCFSSVDVTASRYLGGITGSAASSTTITDCYNTGDMISTSNGGAGGIAGSGSVVMTNCYNTGNISAPAGKLVGGISSSNNKQYYINCHALSGCCIDGRIYGVDTLISADELKALAPTLGASFSADTTGINGGYPVLTWQNTAPLSVEEVMAAINAIGAPVTLDSKQKIDAARTAYELLDAADTDKVTNYQVLLDAENAYAKLKHTVDSIDAIGEVKATKDCKTAIENARTAYNSLDEVAQSNVPNRETLFAAERAFEALLVPIEIKSAEELMAFASRVNEGERLLNACLKADISLEGVEWECIGGTSSNVYAYAGTFDGEGHTITKLVINSTSGYYALFGYVTGVIKNIVVKDSSISGKLICAAIATSNNGTIINCANYADIAVTGGNAGGIVASNSGRIENCANFGSIKAAGYNAGGIASNGSGTIINCYNAGQVETIKNIGGIVGNSSKITIENCYNIGKIAAPSDIVAYQIAPVAGTNCYALVSDGTENFYNVVTEAELKSDEMLTTLGASYKKDSGSINNGYPVLVWQKSEAPVLTGDANGDGIIDSNDAVLVLRYYADSTTEGIDLAAADVNNDGVVDANDAVAILRLYAGNQD